METIKGELAETTDKGLCLEISLRSAPSHIKASDGREIPFTRAVLTLRNGCDAEAVNVVLHATLGQESGTVQEVSSSLAHAVPSSIPPGGTVSLDVYDLLLLAHPGTASKIHMFGYRAALNWKFELAAWAQYSPSVSSEPLQTPVLRWSLRWSVAEPATGAVGLTIEEIKD
jgi:hypothetical protein